MQYGRIVIKVGTNVLTASNGTIDLGVIGQLTHQIAALKQQEVEVVLVSSGAVGTGRSILQLPDSLNLVTKRQVYSSVGQVGLISRYQNAFHQYKLSCAQLLVTKEDFRDREHYINMKRCLLALMRDEIVPIVNENDVISITELMFTDNDELAAMVAGLVNADALFILSNVDGVLRKDGTLIEEVFAEDKAIFEHITTGKSSFGRGGMLTKVRVCQQAAKLGIDTFILNGKKGLVEAVCTNQPYQATHFKARRKKISGLKKWMAQHSEKLEDGVIINEGATAILLNKEKIASLLPVGIHQIRGSFKKGDLVGIYNEKGDKLGIGMAAYSSKKLEELLGKQNEKAFIHYDYLLI